MESASYRNSDGRNSNFFEGNWNVPPAPLNQRRPVQTLFYFTALVSEYPTNPILQPVLEWGQAGRNYWDISSWYILPNNSHYSNPVTVDIGDSLYGFVQLVAANQWYIYIQDNTKSISTSTLVNTTLTFDWNYVALEEYNIDTCNQSSAGNDFTNLQINDNGVWLTPSWQPWVNQTAIPMCGAAAAQAQALGVKIVSPSEVQLKVFPNDTIGVYRPSTGTFLLRNSNSAGNPDITVQYGPVNPTDIVPLVGDWIGQEKTTIGVYQKSTGIFFLKNSNTPGPADITFQFGPGGSDYLPLAGDWTGQGKTTIGVYQKSTGTFYLRNSNTAGPADITFQFGPGGSDYLPLAGDWTGQGKTTIGVYRSSTNTFYLRNSNTAGPADITVNYGVSGDIPIVGDWTGQGKTTIGVYRPSTNTFYLRNSNTAGPADITVNYGISGDTPIDGHWVS